MRYWAHSGLAAAVLALIAACAVKALALDMPGPSAQEVLVKSILATLNDAVASDNFTILHAKISKPFRDQFPPEKLRAVFKDLVEKHAVFDAVVAEKMIADEDARIDEKGVLKLKGRFQTAPKQVKYQLGFIESEGTWKLSGVQIDIE
jgi:nitrogen regulatory protein PII-like uncharacterized protein